MISTWVLLLLVCVLPSGIGKAQADAPRPNILLFYTDDLDFDEINLYDLARYPSHTGMRQQGYYDGKPDQSDYFANPSMLTPNLEKLAEQGLTLNRFYITSPICTPSRFTILTGRYASRSQAFLHHSPAGDPANVNWGTGLKIAETNIAKALQDAGYFTGVVGKWHLGHDISRYSTEMKTLDPMKPEDNQRIIDAHAGTCAAFKEAGFDFADSIYVGNVGEIHVPQMLKRENLPWVTQGAFNFLDLQSPDSDKPFFLYMSLPLPHNQYYDTQNRSGKGAGWWNNDPRATPGGYLDGAPTSQPSSEDVMRRVRAAGLPDVNSMATRIDDCLGAIMAKLDERGLTENTVLIFTSDHQSRGKNTVYEAGRVPFVVRWPGKIPAGVRSDLLSGNVDLPPTFLEWAGAENVPEDMGQDGVSLAQALLNPEDAKPVRDALLLECGYARGVVTDRWKLIACRATDEIEQRMAEDAARAEREGTRRYVGWDGRTNKQFLGRRGFSAGVIMDSDRDFPHYFDADQLYDLDADPFEQVNLFEDEANRKTIEQLQTQLRGFLKTLPHTFGEFTD